MKAGGKVTSAAAVILKKNTINFFTSFFLMGCYAYLPTAPFPLIMAASSSIVAILDKTQKTLICITKCFYFLYVKYEHKSIRDTKY